jgi:hypothetical protein
LDLAGSASITDAGFGALKTLTKLSLINLNNAGNEFVAIYGNLLLVITDKGVREYFSQDRVYLLNTLLLSCANITTTAEISKK